MTKFFQAYAEFLAAIVIAIVRVVHAVARACAAVLRAFARALPWLMLDFVAGLAILWFAYGAYLAWPPLGHMVISIELGAAAFYLAQKFAAVSSAKAAG